MGIFTHPVKNFPFVKMYKAIQTSLKAELEEAIKHNRLNASVDKLYEPIVKAIKRYSEPNIKNVLDKYVRDEPDYKLDIVKKGASYYARILDKSNKEVEKTETSLIKDPKMLIKASAELMVEKTANKAIAAEVVKARQIKPIPVLHKDFASAVMQRAGTRGQFKIEDLRISIVLKNPTVLQHVPNEVSDSLLAQKLNDAANQGEILKQLTEAYIKISKEIATPADEQGAQAQMRAASEAISKQAKARAAKVITDLVKMNVDQNQFNADIKVSLAVAIGGAVLGATATAASLLTAPLHLGMATAASAIATAQSLKTTVHLIIDSGKTVETTSKELGAALASLQKEYKTASSLDVGIAETGKTLANSLIPNFQNSITRIKSLMDQVNGGLQGRELQLHRMAAQLDDIITKTSNMEKKLAEFQKVNQTSLTTKQKAFMVRAEKTTAEIPAVVKEMLKQLRKSVQGLMGLKGSYATMREGVNKLASGKPTWAEVTEVLVGTATTAGFLVAGNIGSPDPYKGMEAFNNMASLVGNIQGSLDLMLNLSKSLEDLIQ